VFADQLLHQQKFTLTVGDLLEERWEVRRFRLWYMEAVKLGLQNIVINIPAKYFQTPTDGVAIVDFHNMH